MYENIEVVRRDQGFAVQATWKEPCEDVFEIALHEGRFENIMDAHRLKRAVLKAMRDAYPRSPSCALDAKRWCWLSSAYGSGIDRDYKPVVIPTTDWAKAEIARMNSGD